jgi:hypothetical protein
MPGGRPRAPGLFSAFQGPERCFASRRGALAWRRAALWLNRNFLECRCSFEQLFQSHWG